MSEPQLDELLSYGELSKRLGVPKGTLYAWKCKGLIPFVQPPGCNPRFIEREVIEWLDRWRKKPGE